MASDTCSFIESLQTRTLLFAKKMSVVWWEGGLEQQRARFYRGARFRISLILSHRNLVGERLPQTLLYAAWLLRQPRPATELCKLHRRARFWKPLELQPAPAASTEKFFSPAYSTNGRFLSVVKWRRKTLGQNRGLIHLVRRRGFQIFFSGSTKFSRKNVRCKLRGFQAGKPFPCRSR